MNTRGLFIIIFAVLLVAQPALAGSFSPAQHELLDHIVGSALTEFRQDAGHMESMLANLATAYTRSGYDKDPGSLQVLQRLREQTTTLTEEISKLETLVSRHGAESNNPAVMLLLLSREQSVGFHIYRWVRSVTELTNLANASTHRDDPVVARLCTAMIETGEAGQETLATSIQGLTGVIGSPSTP